MAGAGGQLSKAVRILIQATDKTGGKLKATAKDLKNIDKQAAASGKSLDKTGKNAKRLSGSFMKLAGAAAAVGAAALAISFPVRQAAAFERAMSEVKAITSASSGTMTQMSDVAKDLGRTTEFTAQQAAQGMKMLGMAGLTAAETIAAIKPALDLALVGSIELGQSADFITNIMGGMGLAVGDLTQIVDVLATTATSSNSTVVELAEAMSYAAPAANAMGVSLEATAAAMGVLHDNGIKGSRAGSAMRGMLSKLAAPTKKAEAALKKLGVQISFNENGTLDFIQTLKDLRDSGMGLAEANDLFGRYAGTAGIAAAKQADKIERLTRANEDAEGAAARMAMIMSDNMAGAMKRFSSAVSGAAIEIGEHFLPALRNTIEKMGDWINAFTDWAKEHPKTTKFMTTFALGLTAVAAIMVTLTAAVWAFNAAGAAILASGVVSSLTLTAGAAAGATTAMGALGLAFTAVAVAVGGLVAGYSLGKFINQLMGFKSGVELVAEARKDLASQTEFVNSSAGPQLDSINEKLGTAFKSMDDLFTASDIGKVYFDELTGEWENSMDFIVAETDEAAQERIDIEEAALKEMESAYKKWSKTVLTIQDKIWGREKSLAQELRAMGRSGMTEVGAWKDRRNEAKKYYSMAQAAIAEGKRLAASGDSEGAFNKFKQAGEYADDAKDAYKDLNTEVKKGDKVILSGSKALEYSMKNVQKAGNLAIDALGAQKVAAKEAMESLNEASGGAFDGPEVTESVDRTIKEVNRVKTATGEVAIDWGQKMREMGMNAKGSFDPIWKEMRKIDNTVLTVYVNQVEKKMAGGMAGVQKFATGGFAKRQGKLAGFGGGDRIKALLEAGEYIINKSAVRKYGPGLFQALNSMSFNPGNMLRAKIGGMISNVGSLVSAPMMAGAGGGGESINLNLNLPTAGPPISMQADRFNAGEIMAQLEKMGRRSS